MTITYAAESPTWTDTGTFWIALAALLISVVAAAAAIWSAVAGHRSANHAKTSAEAAKDSAGTARVAARAAEKSADADGKVAQVELGRDHRELAPSTNWVSFSVAPDGQGSHNAFITFTPPERGYLLFVSTHHEGSSGRITRRSFVPVPAGKQELIQIGESGRKLPDWVEMRIYPPAPGSEGEAWSCPCGLPTTTTDIDGGGGHWLLRVPVEEGGLRRAMHG
ncbi:hypothetical protein GCM10010172_07440 [Paractinoplanes ferrugineus]|uniref:Uncharacterized protein n=1 Tax=Paractinoplanes ferrugineus TaxID=113564 RepID=A0A919JBA1_9ACTN|nr:hypothetical protein [Actinoplanes ferrugineus]GIE16889.1 hypothetical protein Afe05nite_87290 [Actinoplanes ferrugineus]